MIMMTSISQSTVQFYQLTGMLVGSYISVSQAGSLHTQSQYSELQTTRLDSVADRCQNLHQLPSVRLINAEAQILSSTIGNSCDVQLHRSTIALARQLFMHACVEYPFDPFTLS
jgi:hypothetical protein